MKLGCLICVLIFSLSTSKAVLAQTDGDYRSIVDGNWSTLATWQRYNNPGVGWAAPTVGQGYPGQNSVPTAVTIQNTDDVTLDVSPANNLGSLALQAGNSTSSITFSGTNSLTVNGAITINSGTGSGDDKTIAVGAGSLTCGSVSMATTGNDNRTNLLSVSTGTITVIGNLTMNDGDPQRNIVSLTGAGTLNVGGALNGGNLTTVSGSTVDYNGAAQTLRAVTYNGNLILSGSGDKDLNGVTSIGGNFTLGGTASTTATAGITVSGGITLGSGTSFTAGAFTHNVAGAWTNNGGTFVNTGSTVNLNGAAQSIGGSSSTTFNNLTLAGSNTKTFNIATFVSSSLTIRSGVIADLSTFTTHTANALYFEGAAQVAGTWGGTTSGATNINSTFFATATGILTTAVEGASTYYSRQTGDWNSITTWSTVTYGSAVNTGTYPLAGDIVNIGGGNFTITVTADADCGSLNFQGDVGNSPTVALNSAITLNVSGNIYLPTTSGFSGDVNTLAVGAGILNAAGIDFDVTSVFGGNALTISTGTVTVTGDIANGSILSTEITFTGAGLLRVGGACPGLLECVLTPSSGTVEYNGAASQTVELHTYNNLTLSGTGTKSTEGALNIDGTLTLESGASFTGGQYTHTLAGDWVNNGATFNNTSTTINLDGGAQSIGGSASTTFNNLTLSGSATKTFGLSTTIIGMLSINSGIVANLGSITTHTAQTLLLNGAGQAPGTWGSTSSSASNQDDTYFTAGTSGILTVNGRIYYSRQTGNWNANATWSTVTYGNATNSGTFPTANDIANIGGGDFTVTVNVNSSCASLNYQAGADNSPIVSISSGISLDVSGSINIPHAGTFFGSDANTLAVGAGILNAGSIAFSTGSSLFGSHALTILSGTATVNGDVTQSFPNAIITFTGAGTLVLRGAFLNSSNCTFTRGTGTVNYNGAITQNIGDFTYYNLLLNNTSSTIPQLSLLDNTTATNALTMTSGVVNLSGNTFTLGAGTAASTLSRTASTTTNWMYGGSFTRIWPTGQTPSSSAGNLYGLFPLGHSTASSYRPVAITGGSNVTTAGSVTFTHVNANTSTDLSPVYDDAGTNIVRKNDAQFVGSVSGVAGGTNYSISVTMTDLAAGTPSDIRLAVSSGATTVTNVGTHVANTGTAPNPTVGRSGLSVANLTGDFRITTTNSATTPLPIELIRFSASLRNDVVLLDWTTASEFNNDFFTIERASNIEEFEVTGLPIDGAGTTKERKDYAVVDEYPLYGRSYYRLKQTDFDGKFTYSDVRVVDYEGPKFASLRAYPNPSNGMSLTVLVTGLKERTAVPLQIYNIQGQLLYNGTVEVDTPGTLKHEIEFGNPLRSGIYLIKAGPTLQLTQKIFIE